MEVEYGGEKQVMRRCYSNKMKSKALASHRLKMSAITV
jgi:hypothetical protein